MLTLRLATTIAITVAVSGCFGFQSGSSELNFTPGEDYEVTGRTVHLKAAIADLVMHEVYPGFYANMWAFCFTAADPADTYSQNAIEYFDALPSDGEIQGVGEEFAGKCSSPGPTLRVGQGDRVIVDVANNHFHSHTIHWHGQHVPWNHDGAQGATQDSIVPGDTFRYDFIASRAGTLWYHCHVDVHFHVMQGLFGVIIVEPQNERFEPEDIDKEYVFVYGTIKRDLVQVTPLTAADPHINHRHKPGECGASGVPECQNPPVDTTPDTWTLNGRSMPNTMMDREQSVIIVKEGERVRVRMLNAGETMETIHTHGHDMLVTHRDGNPIPPAARFWVDTLTIGPAERYDVVLEMNNPGIWMMHSHIDAHVTNDHQSPGGAMTMIAYESTLITTGDKLMNFSSELPGGKPWIIPLAIPDDMMFGKDVHVANGVSATPTAVSEEFEFPWELPCSARYLRVRAVIDPMFTPPADPIGSLTFEMRDADGSTIEGSSVAFANGEAQWVLDGRFDPLADQASKDNAAANRKVMIEKMKSGDYTAVVTGTAVPSTLRFSAELDYHESYEGLVAETIYASLDLKKGTGDCSENARVFDPAA